MPPTEAGQPAPVEEPFSLAPAIFTPFPGFSKEAPPLEQQEKLEKIIENLDKQHDAVKKNMMFLIERRGDDLVKKAKGELAVLGDGESAHQENAQLKKDLESMIRRTRVPMKGDAKPGAYEITGETFKDAEPNLFVSEDQDVEMGNTYTAQLRTQTTIRADLTHELRDLVTRGASEMEAYDAHAEETMKKYKQALERRKGKNGPSISASGPPSAPPPKSILTNRHVESPIDKEAIRRMPAFKDLDDMPRRGR